MRNQPREGGRREREEGEGRGRGRSEEEVVKAGAASPGHKFFLKNNQLGHNSYFVKTNFMCVKVKNHQTVQALHFYKLRATQINNSKSAAWCIPARILPKEKQRFRQRRWSCKLLSPITKLIYWCAKQLAKIKGNKIHILEK